MTTVRACYGGTAAAADDDEGALEQEVERDHVIIFPFMAKGHTIPLLHLGAALSNRGLHVTFITTPANAPFIINQLPSGSHPLIDVLTIPFPRLPPLPPDVESTDSLPSFDLYTTFLQATALLRDDFHRLLVQLVSARQTAAPLCLISDFFLGWTLPICKQVGLPRLVFHGMSAFAMGLCKALWLHQPFAAGDKNFHVPGAPQSLLLTQSDVPADVRMSADKDNKVTQIITQTVAWEVESWGVVVNSFTEIEREYIGLLESFYQGGARAWLVGPLCLLGGTGDITGEKSDTEGCLQWLDGRAAKSAVFVSFGTQAQVTDDQLDEVAHGLKQSGHDFLLSVRSKTWTPPENLGPNGKIVSTWVPQMEVLKHVAVGAFLSHCGWNSVLESLCAGVPILCWPMIAEQMLNARHVADIIGAGMRLRSESGRVVGRDEVAEGVREVMGDGDRGRMARKRAAELRITAEEAVADRGSSRASLDELLENLRDADAGKG